MVRVGIIGLGKLGLPLACLFGSNSDNQVTGYDINEDYINNLLLGKFKPSEPDCNYENTVCFTSSMETLVERTDIAFLCVNTPSIDNSVMDLSQVRMASESLDVALKGKPYKLVVCSTVLPGTCRDYIQPLVGNNVDVSSSPVWIAMGSVIKDLKNPPVLLVGSDQENGYIEVLKVWSSISEVHPDNIIFTDTRTAEFLKLAHNSWCTTKMSYMGYLKDQSERLGINIQDVSRFFQNGGERPGAFWKPGPSFSGPCFPRDLRFWNEITRHPITYATESINEDRILQIVGDTPKQARVLILGSGYKYGVHITEGALSRKLKEAYREYRPEVNVQISDIPEAYESWATYTIVLHKELEDRAPKNSKVVKLW